MTKQKAIRGFCLECGGSAKDVVFCPDPRCLLWEYRLGTGMDGERYWSIMEANRRKYPKDVAELGEYGLSPSLYFDRKGTYGIIKRSRTKDEDKVDHIDQVGRL